MVGTIPRAHTPRGGERRRHARVAVTVRVDIGLDGEENLASFQTIDVSSGGCRARGHLLVPKYETVVAVFVGDHRMVATLARVAWSDVHVREGTVDLGLEFEHLAPPRARRLAMIFDEARGRSPGRGQQRMSMSSFPRSTSVS